MADRIQPRTLKGFRDFLPEAELQREAVFETARTVFRSYGFVPIDTPALEYTEILMGKGSDETDKQLYRFTDNGGRDVAMRFDLTVPLARYAAQHIGELGTPFRRYHIGSVWRGENTQRGRYREFMQCDFDTIGTESVVSDIETALVIHDLLTALGIERFTVRINNRRLLNGLLEARGLTDQATGVLRSLDKLDKVGPDAVRSDLVATVGIPESDANALVDLAALRGGADILDQVDVGDSELGARGIDELRQFMAGVEAAGVEPGRIVLDMGIARGLDYYTGTVYETVLDDLPDIGSVCSGGRYDDLASLYTNQRLPGVGASLGVDRLLAALEELSPESSARTSAPVLMTLFDDSRRSEHLAVVAGLRRAGVGVELYPEARKLGAQLKYGDRRGHTLAVIIGDTEWDDETAQIKVLATGDSHVVDQDELADACRRLLGDA
ncbi:MAG: histidine--tRNA ligase [Acidimicrobiia bacterium]|nr:histidine--tRNA ligase [Acidimicrobiia bacterium]